jgi:2,3-bisphosphoglycerate-independent phosphoglycerate mutase
MDRLAELGMNGLFHADRWGVALPSENAHFSMFGYGKDEFPGRGILEALGAGIDVAPGDVALLAHFVHAEEQEGVLILKNDKPPAESDDVAAIFGAVASHELEDVRIRLTQTHRLRGIVTLQGAVSRYVTDTDPIWMEKPLLEPRPWKSATGDRGADRTARVLRSYLLHCHRLLAGHPVNRARADRGALPLNTLVTQRAGQMKSVEPFPRRWGLRGLSIASAIVYWGLAGFLGMDVRKVADGPDAGADLAERLDLALSSLETYDFIHIHTKAPDEAAHRRNPTAKKEAIEALDRGIGQVIERLLGNPEILVVLTSDHSTPSVGSLIHSGEPVPMTLVGREVRRDEVCRFNEVDCVSGALGFVRGAEFMPLVLNWLDRAKLQGLMDTPENRPFWPGVTVPLRVE